MQTDDLIAVLTEDVRPVAPGLVQRRLLTFGATGLFGTVALMLVWMPPRPDLVQAMGGLFYWEKSLYTLSFAVAGMFAIERLARPDGTAPAISRRVVTVAAALMAAAAVVGLMLTAPALWMHMWMGDSARVCSVRILVLAVPVLATTLMATRSLAPTRLRAAGFAAGLLSGGLSATVYALHCPESTALFVLSWYSLGVLACGAVGALLGPVVLRWR